MCHPLPDSQDPPVFLGNQPMVSYAELHNTRQVWGEMTVQVAEAQLSCEVATYGDMDQWNL